MVVSRTEFPWLHTERCGCHFSRLPTVDGKLTVLWNPCGAHMVRAAIGQVPGGWPPQLTHNPEPAHV